MLDAEELLEIVLPLLRADLLVCRSPTRWPEHERLPLPIAALGGRPWPARAGFAGRPLGVLTTGAFRLELLPGGHHYLYDDQAAAAAAVSRALLGTPAEPHR